MSEVLSERYEYAEIDPKETECIADLRPRIDGNHTMRSAFSRLTPSDEEEPIDNQDLHFGMFIFENDEDSQVRVVADLNVVVDSVLVGVSIYILIELDGVKNKPITEEQATALGKWVTHAAYDFAALNMRLMVANNPIIEKLEIPLKPIKPEFQFVQLSDE
ncbi:hypothetical protein [Corynebacterium glutamicum]|uniref:hypothetical protein n=1 Tax=Corynebacterium glutamicum TaxID=1718 RepID=UPI001469062F|nr:hypothetical protein [Corynebacterium glutamicum]GFK19212.1 hypothetical protein KbCgl_17840 [Corynebacterium glutamicum]